MKTTYSSGHWYAVASSRELTNKPLGKVRFGKRFVFWRDQQSRIIGMPDQCPHRGAALSLGRIEENSIACPYHGFEFSRDGRCSKIPAEGDWQIPSHFRIDTLPVRESQGYVWLWRGPQMPNSDLPPVPIQSLPTGSIFGECLQQWPSHYTRCIEGVIDHSHLGFVHRKTLGLFLRDPVTRIRVDEIAGGFRSNLIRKNSVRHHIDFTYPNIWTQSLNENYAMSTTFAPIDESHTEVYCRWHHRLSMPVVRQLVDIWGRFSQFMVFHEDMPILDSQRPANSDDAAHEKLVPSDAAIMAFRKMRRTHSEELALSSNRRPAEQGGREDSVLPLNAGT